MRVTFTIASADMAGGCKVVSIYVRELIALGHEAIVISPPPRAVPLRSRLRSALRGNFSALIPPKHVSHLELLGVPHTYLDRYRPITAADVPDADVIIGTWWETMEWIRDFPRSKGARAYFIQGNETDLGNDRERVMRTWDVPSQKITVSSWLLELVKERTAEEDIALVPNTVDRAQFDAPPRGKQPRPTLGVAYASIPLKGFDVACRAIARIRKEIPDLRIVTFASSKPVTHQPLPAGAEFTYRPPQDHIRELYASCDVWLSSSRAEGFGLPALEAMACRCPLVSTRYGGPADFLRDDENGYLVDVDDDEALARRAIEILQAPEAKWRQLSDAAYATAHRYTWTDATLKLVAALEHAIEKAPRT